MLGRRQVFVRARVAENRSDSVDVLDLDDESFRRFVLSVLYRYELITAMSRDADNPPLQAKPSIKKT